MKIEMTFNEDRKTSSIQIDKHACSCLKSRHPEILTPWPCPLPLRNWEKMTPQDRNFFCLNFFTFAWSHFPVQTERDTQSVVRIYSEWKHENLHTAERWHIANSMRCPKPKKPRLKLIRSELHCNHGISATSLLMTPSPCSTTNLHRRKDSCNDLDTLIQLLTSSMYR